MNNSNYFLSLFLVADFVFSFADNMFFVQESKAVYMSFTLPIIDPNPSPLSRVNIGNSFMLSFQASFK